MMNRFRFPKRLRSLPNDKMNINGQSVHRVVTDSSNYAIAEHLGPYAIFITDIIFITYWAQVCSPVYPPAYPAFNRVQWNNDGLLSLQTGATGTTLLIKPEQALAKRVKPFSRCAAVLIGRNRSVCIDGQCYSVY